MIARATILDERELAAWKGMLRAHAAITRELDAQLVAEHSLPLSSYEVLMALATAEKGELRMAELADEVLLSRSGLTRMVDRLAKDGHVERRPCADDARGQLAAVTPAGRKLFERARRTHLDGVRELFHSRLDDNQLDQLAAVWNKLG